MELCKKGSYRFKVFRRCKACGKVAGSDYYQLVRSNYGKISHGRACKC